MTLTASPAPPAAAPSTGACAGAEPLPAAVLADIAAGLAAAPPLWRSVVRHDPDGRRPARLLATDRYEVWVIGWTTGQHVRLHDHGTSAGAVVVAEGELVEVVPRVGGPPVEHVLGGVRPRHLAVGTVHDVVNRAAAPATSIHVYSPPLTSMTYYDDDLTPVATDPVAPERPVLAPRAAARALHPSAPRPRQEAR